MNPPEAAFGRLPPGGAASGPAKRLRFSEGSYRASDVMPQLKPDPRRLLGRVGFMPQGCHFGAIGN